MPHPSRTRRRGYVELQAVLRDARARGLKVSISGSHDSQGGHTYYPGAGGKTGVVELREERRHLGYR